MKINTAVIPIAGWGTRLLPVSLLVAKEFLPLGRKPAIQHICEQLADCGIGKIVFVTSQRKANVVQLFQENETVMSKLTGSKAPIAEQFWTSSEFSEVVFETTVQHEQLGLGHAVLCAQENVDGQPFALALGDCPVGTPGQSNIMQRMIEEFEAQDAQIAISFEQVAAEQVSRYGIAKPGLATADSFTIEDLIEKPDAASAPSNYAVCGRYLFSPQVFSYLQKQEAGKGGEIQLTDAVRAMINDGAKAIGVPLPEGQSRYDVGGMESYVQSFVEFAMADPELRQFVKKAMDKQR